MQSSINIISQDKYLPVRKEVCIDEVSTSFYETVNTVEDNKYRALKHYILQFLNLELIQYYKPNNFFIQNVLYISFNTYMPFHFFSLTYADPSCVK